ncbi:MAG: hypothetical protein WAP35_08620 [Solirubrobacterales bacterium]
MILQRFAGRISAHSAVSLGVALAIVTCLFVALSADAGATSKKRAKQHKHGSHKQHKHGPHKPHKHGPHKPAPEPDPLGAKCSGSDIVGFGTSTQSIAQEVWFGFWRTHTSPTKTRGCGYRAKQNIDYYADDTHDGGLRIGPGAFGPGNPARFTTADNAPTPAERQWLEGNASVAGPARLATVPAAQSALVVVANFPKHCELPTGDPDLAPYARFRLSNERLATAWFGDQTYDQWGELLPGIQAIPGNRSGRTDVSCKQQPVLRVVPPAQEQQTRQFKTFVQYAAPTLDWHSSFAGSTWPNPTNVRKAFGSSARDRAHTLLATPGSIAYLDLATARVKGLQKRPSHSGVGAEYVYQDSNRFDGYPAYGKKYSFYEQTFWIPLEAATTTGYSGSGQFVEPTIDRLSIRTGRRGANCRDTYYRGLPTHPSGRINPLGDWSGASTLLEPGAYPTCSLSYIAFWDDYADVYGQSVAERRKARTVKDFITTSLYSGQNILYRYDYAPLPVHDWQNIRFASQRAISLMSWKKP